MVWALFKVYLNNPNMVINRSDVLASVFMRGTKDLHEFMKKLKKLRIKEYKEDITYGQLLTKIGIKI